jgi:hypothetical protein
LLLQLLVDELAADTPADFVAVAVAAAAGRGKLMLLLVKLGKFPLDGAK